jgi:hypothetical protein
MQQQDHKLSDDDLTIPATLIRREKYAPAWGVLLKPLESILAFLPSHRATKKGRTNAKQIRIGVMIVGLAVMIYGGTLPLIFTGAAIMVSALFLPMSEVTKGAWRGKLRRMRTRQERDAESAGTIVYDGKRLILFEGDRREGDKKLRRVLIDRGAHNVDLRRRALQKGQVAACLGVSPSSGKKAESIWVCTPEDSVTVQPTEEITGEDVDIWAHVTPNDWKKIHDLLNK